MELTNFLLLLSDVQLFRLISFLAAGDFEWIKGTQPHIACYPE